MPDTQSRLEDLFRERLAKADRPRPWSWPPLSASHERRSCTRALGIDLEFSGSPDQLALSLLARFAVDRISRSRRSWLGRSVDRYSVEFGFSGGELDVMLLNGTAPFDHRYGAPMPASAQIQLTRTVEGQTENTSELGGEIGAEGPKFTAKLGGKASRKASEQQAISFAHAHITAVGDLDGDESFPRWRFSSALFDKPLEGDTPPDDKPLAIVSRSGDPVKAFAVFTIGEGNIEIGQIHGAKSERRAVLKRALEEEIRRRSEAADGRMIVACALQTSLDFALPPQPAELDRILP